MSTPVRTYYDRSRQDLAEEKRQRVWGIWFNSHKGVYWIGAVEPSETLEIGPWRYIGVWPKSEIGYIKETFRF